MSLLRIAIRGIVVYVFALALIRVSGKRLLSEATGIQFVLAIILGDLVDDAMFATVPFAQFVVAAGTLTLVHMTTAIAAMFNLSIWKLVEGEPPILVQNGTLQRKAMRHERINRKEIASMLRLVGISAARWAEIKRGRMEEEGQLAVIVHDWAKPAQRRDADWVKARMRAKQQ
jgi:uncharacterized membrane protein YcaP (DUF421 family)